MRMPVKLSDDLVLSARLEAEATDRSVTAQIEHWAKLGRAVEAVLKQADVLALQQSGGDLAQIFPNPSKRKAIQALLERIAWSSDRSGVVEKLRARGRPVYSTDPHFPGRVIRIEPDGTRTLGGFENRRFVLAAKA